MTEQEQRTLARLRRAESWTEDRRKGGYVFLVGKRGDKIIHDELPEETLKSLLAQGEVEYWTGQRLEDVSVWRLRPGFDEVTRRYWKAKDNG